ncbi:MAG: hypothetical protein HN742_07545 [Lentisphaerae bacterium]|jgi:hypothetical protein|nr:hypothetical protein [Lentisphaerota bacterium]MBT4817185.1 hypothetical protein [Lentisphaerota bacterium]MBT5609401.1 hypothetical protein [Lentisphaerota bacterium]MBT7060222.1 hypothetical protein [Lentisphaerota bacterium]MBT7841709.1 hypothetical protein [Lentisphaerota bacterium]
MSVIDIASRRELFVDQRLIDGFDGDARLKLHPPKREEIVFQVDGPLENACSGVYNVLVEHDGRYLLYYRGHYPIENKGGDSSHQQTSNVAISEDGIRFERPELDILDLGDGRRNNAVWQGIQAHNLVAFRDTNPACTPDERFKAVGGTGTNNLYALYSPDGIHWRLAQDAPLEVSGAFDSANVPLWDAGIGKYRLFSRFFEKERGRAIQSCTSDDFIHWTTPVPHQYDEGVPVEQFYTNATVTVPGAEHILLSFPMRYVAERTTPLDDISEMDYPGTGAPGMAGMTDGVMMSSRDGVHWNRPFPEAWVRAGLDDRNWTHRNTCPAIGILPLCETEWSMYVSEHYGWPDNRLRRLSLRPWGFASINAGWQGGGVVTKPLTFDGSELKINVSTSAVGAVRIELQNADGSAIPGYALDDMAPIYGDQLDRPVSWNDGASVGKLAGRPMKLHFELKDADVFSFRFVE